MKVIGQFRLIRQFSKMSRKVNPIRSMNILKRLRNENAVSAVRCFLILGFCIQQSFCFSQTLSSEFIALKDGVKLAADIYLPENYNGEKLPTLIQFERYWRSQITRKEKDKLPALWGRSKLFSDSGYVIVVVDTRGSGASFGTRISEYSPRQVMDSYEVLDWVTEQSWSDGNIGSFGTSYTGTTAELLCATKHPALKAVVPGWSDFDIYRSPVRPYGMLASSFIRKWGLYVKLLDRNRKMILGSRIYPVHKDSLKPALKEHRDNLEVFPATKNGEFRQSPNNKISYEECSVVHWQTEIEESNVPMLVLTSWMDAGTAEGTIQRLEHFSNPQKVVLMATSHGGWSHASPYSVGEELIYPEPRYEVQNKMELDFFDHYVKGEDRGVEEWPLMSYYNMGEEAFKTSNSWPIEGTEEVPFYFHEGNVLSDRKVVKQEGSDEYKVDFGVKTSKNNRWTTQMEGGVLNLNDRGEMDERMLTYTSEPLTEDLQITGTPVVRIEMSSTTEDGAVLVYLEDVDENGNSTYITEGGLRLIHRKEVTDGSSYNMHSFAEKDAMPMVQGETTSIGFKLWPTSVQIKKGHSIRIAIAGADKSTFDRVPKRGAPVYTIERNSVNASRVILPVVRASGK